MGNESVRSEEEEAGGGEGSRLCLLTVLSLLNKMI